MLALWRGAVEDPALARVLSWSGFTMHEEVTAQVGDMTSALLNAFLRASFQRPPGGWPRLTGITRPTEAKRLAEEQKKPKRQATGKELAAFIKRSRSNRG